MGVGKGSYRAGKTLTRKRRQGEGRMRCRGVNLILPDYQVIEQVLLLTHFDRDVEGDGHKIVVEDEEGEPHPQPRVRLVRRAVVLVEGVGAAATFGEVASAEGQEGQARLGHYRGQGHSG